VLADVVERYAQLHVTEQNIQFHFLKPADVETVMRRMADEGITTREACGNSVRNITACPFAGVAADEVFDVTPYAEALTRYFLRHPLSAVLPRKFKIAFEGCPEDHALASINDLGWTARVEIRDGREVRGFRLTAVAAHDPSDVQARTVQFLPASDAPTSRSDRSLHRRLGDHEHRQATG
jgi:sulfite reductase (NADPH) hemoprotein beta-component